MADAGCPLKMPIAKFYKRRRAKYQTPATGTATYMPAASAIAAAAYANTLSSEPSSAGETVCRT